MLNAILAGFYVSLILSSMGIFGKVIIHDRLWAQKIHRDISRRYREYRLNKILRERECL